jgi:hypothetical protein
MPWNDDHAGLLRMAVYVMRSAMPRKLPTLARETAKHFGCIRLGRGHRGIYTPI